MAVIILGERNLSELMLAQTSDGSHPTLEFSEADARNVLGTQRQQGICGKSRLWLRINNLVIHYIGFQDKNKGPNCVGPGKKSDSGKHDPPCPV